MVMMMMMVMVMVMVMVLVMMMVKLTFFLAQREAGWGSSGSFCSCSLEALQWRPFSWGGVEGA